MKNKKSKSNAKSPPKNQTKEKETKKETKKEAKGKTKKKKTEEPVVVAPKLVKFNLDFIYRREKYTLKNLMSNFLVSGVKKLISKKLNIDIKELKFYYLDNELKEDKNKTNVYEMIKKNQIQYFEVKKEIAANDNIISLNAQANLIYQVKCTNINDYKDFIGKIEKFFKDLCIEQHYLCEPTSLNSYIVNFSCEDNCFQFKRYMMNIMKSEESYAKSKFSLIPVDKSKVINLKNDLLNSKDKKVNTSEFIDEGPYLSTEDRKKLEEKEDKKKWINKKGFSS